MADRKLSMEELVPRTLRVRGALRSMMATFKRAAQEQRSADNDEADLAKGYGRTLDEALTLFDNILEVDLSPEVLRAVEKDRMFALSSHHIQRQLLLVLLRRAGEVEVSMDELDSVGGGIAVDMHEEGRLVIKLSAEL